MFFVRVQTVVKNRIYIILDRNPEILSQAPNVSDLFGASGIEWLKQVALPVKIINFLVVYHFENRAY
jgi:hypothetical protein